MLGELAKAAKLLKELRTCQSDEESLNRVTVVANHAVWVDETWKSVSLHAKQALRERVKAANYGDLGLVFQVYFNLGELDRVVEADPDTLADAKKKGAFAKLCEMHDKGLL